MPPPSFRSLLLVDSLLLSLLVLSTRLATLLHEAAGHALAAAALGGRVGGVYVSLFGGGGTAFDLPTDAGEAAWLCAAWGGIAVNLLTAAAPFALARRSAGRPAWGLFAALFGLVSLLGAIAYAALGSYYGFGDPAIGPGGALRDGGRVWIPFLIAAPAAAYAAGRLYGTQQERMLPAASAGRRIATGALTLGVAAAVYAGLYAATAQRLVAADAPAEAYARAEEEVRQRKTEEAIAAVRAEHPELTAEEAARRVDVSAIEVGPEEVPTRFPLVPVIAILYMAGGATGLARAKPAAEGQRVTVAPRTVAAITLVAAAVLALLAGTGGRVI